MAATSLTRYLIGRGQRVEQLDHTRILGTLSVAMKAIAVQVSRGKLIIETPPGAPMPTLAEYKQALRATACRILFDQVQGLPELAAVSVSRDEQIHHVSPGGRYLLLLDPIHGVSTLDDNLSVGSAFSILPMPTEDGTVAPGRRATQADFLQPGTAQVCAGLTLFGPRTLLVLTSGDGVDGFTLDRERGNFVLTHPGITIPAGARVFAIDAGEAQSWPPPVRRFVDECVRGESGPLGHDYTMRWNASAVVGAYRALKNGGIFLVPPITRRGAYLAPLLHTAAPLALLTEQAGGAATTGARRLLEETPTSLDTRVPLYLGEEAEISRLACYVDEHEKGLDAEVDYPLFRHRSLFTV